MLLWAGCHNIVNEDSTGQTEPWTAVDAEWQILPALPWEGDLNELDVNDGAPPHWMSRFVSGRDSQARATWKRCCWGAETEDSCSKLHQCSGWVSNQWLFDILLGGLGKRQTRLKLTRLSGLRYSSASQPDTQSLKYEFCSVAFSQSAVYLQKRYTYMIPIYPHTCVCVYILKTINNSTSTPFSQSSAQHNLGCQETAVTASAKATVLSTLMVILRTKTPLLLERCKITTQPTVSSLTESHRVVVYYRILI